MQFCDSYYQVVKCCNKVFRCNEKSFCWIKISSRSRYKLPLNWLFSSFYQLSQMWYMNFQVQIWTTFNVCVEEVCYLPLSKCTTNIYCWLANCTFFSKNVKKIFFKKIRDHMKIILGLAKVLTIIDSCMWCSIKKSSGQLTSLKRKN